jgi:hypothetical protein
LAKYMACPRLHQLSNLQGWTKAEAKVDIEFGKMYHEAVEAFDRHIMEYGSASWENATLAALGAVLEMTEPGEPGDFWGGIYQEVWRCTGTARSRKPRCSQAKWQAGSKPNDICGECGQPLEEAVLWVPLNKYKNRETLIRTVLEYCEVQPRDGSLRPYRFPNGQDGLELEFLWPLPLESPDGDPYMVRGFFDSFLQMGEEVAPRERKTTKSSLGKFYWDRYEPNVQVDIYDLTTQMLMPEMRHAGVLMEAAQTGVGFSRVERHFITVPASRREEWLGEMQYWIKRAEYDARQGYWPKNTASCNNAGGCHFRDVCRRAPEHRQAALENHFVHREEPITR